MYSPFRRLIPRALLLIGLMTTVASCGAAPRNQDSPQVTTPRGAPKSVQSSPVPTAASTNTPTPSISPSSTSTPNGASAPFITGSIELRVPKEPVRVEAQIKPTEVKPFEIKPMEVRFAKEPIQFSAVPIEMKWPQEPLKVSVDINGGGEKQTKAVRSCNCNRPPEDVRPKTVDVNEWQKRIDELNRKIDADLAAAMKELEERRNANRISQEAFEEEKEKLEQELEAKRKEAPEKLRKREMASERRSTFGIILLAGLLGGLATHMLDYLRTTKPFKEDLKRLRAGNRQNSKAKDAAESEKDSELLKELEEKIHTNKQEQEDLRERIRSERRTWWTRYELGPVLFLGVVAAFMVPGALLFIPLIKLQDVSADPFGYISLASFSFITAMIGEPFIEFVLQKLRNLTTEKGASEKAVPSDAKKASRTSTGRKLEL